ncbi:MAG: chromate transporter [Oligoflexia bacterium]|nr:chromate transporter [Oligoflexia bacterium]
MLDIIKTFLRIGLTSFGGPVVAFSMIEEELVSKRKWLSTKDFSQALTLVKILPGPTASQLLMHTIRMCRGRLMALAAGISFFMPSYFCIMGLGILLGSVGQSTAKQSFESGMAVAALVIILQSTWRLARGSIKGNLEIFLTILAAAIVYFAPGAEPLFILVSGFLGILVYYLSNKKLEASIIIILIYLSLKAALFAFGTGLAIIPLLKSEVVGTLKIMTEKEFMDAIVLGQVTPGPVIMTISWIGYKAAGWWGSIVSTFFVFIPGIIISLFVLPLFEKKTKDSLLLKEFYKFAVPAVIGALIAVIIKLGFENLKGVTAWAIFCSCLILVFWKNPPTWFLIPFFGLVSIGLNKLPSF